MADPTAIIYVYDGPVDRSEHLEGIPARDLTQADLDELSEDRLKELKDHMEPKEPVPAHDPIYAVPAKSKSQRRLRAEAQADQAAFQATVAIAHAGVQVIPAPAAPKTEKE